MLLGCVGPSHNLHHFIMRYGGQFPSSTPFLHRKLLNLASGHFVRLDWSYRVHRRCLREKRLEGLTEWCLREKMLEGLTEWCFKENKLEGLTTRHPRWSTDKLMKTKAGICGGSKWLHVPPVQAHDPEDDPRLQSMFHFCYLKASSWGQSVVKMVASTVQHSTSPKTCGSQGFLLVLTTCLQLYTRDWLSTRNCCM